MQTERIYKIERNRAIGNSTFVKEVRQYGYTPGVNQS